MNLASDISTQEWILYGVFSVFVYFLFKMNAGLPSEKRKKLDKESRN